MPCQFCNSNAPDYSWCSCPKAIEYSEELSALRDIDTYNHCTTSAEAFTDACFDFGEGTLHPDQSNISF